MLNLSTPPLQSTRCDDADAVAGEGCDGGIGSSIADFAKDKLNLDIDSLTEGVPRWMVLLWSVTVIETPCHAHASPPPWRRSAQMAARWSRSLRFFAAGV